MQRSTIKICTLSFLVTFTGTFHVIAHQLSVFAWVEGDSVLVEARLPKGKHPKLGDVRVYDGKDKLLLETKLQPDGTTSFPLENWETGLRIVVDIGHGHQSYWILTPFEISEQHKQSIPKE